MDPIVGRGPLKWNSIAEAKRPKFKLPKGYADEGQFIHEMLDLFTQWESFDFDNHVAGVEDLQFLVGDQWDWMVREIRTIKKKPVLTINRLPAFVAQVLGSRKQNETEIQIAPDTGGDKAVAQVREDLIRSIQKDSHADFIYDKALEGAVTCGIGNFQLDIDYFGNDVWNQEIRLQPIDDHFSVVWDRSITDGTGQDAKGVFVLETMPYDDFIARYPWATPANIMNQRMPAELITTGWYEKGDVRVVDYWRMRTKRRMYALMLDGSTEDVTDASPSTLAKVMLRGDGKPYAREVNVPYAQLYRCSGTEILAGPYELQIDRVPVFRVPGWEIKIGDKMHRWGLIRHMKDPQRLHNYWRSSIAERIMQSPRAVWLAPNSAVAGREQAWRNAHLSDDTLLIYNDETATPPTRNDPVQVEQALILQAEMTTQDLKDVSNIHEANLGMPSNEVSGAAIRERVAVSDTGTILYHDNLTKAIEAAGRTINQLIDIVYDEPRMIKVIGKDAKQQMIGINQLTQAAVDITQGKYSVTVENGPSYATKRQQAAESMLSLAQSMPQVLGVAPDLLVEAMDWPMSDEISARLKRALPPGILTPDEMTPDIQAKMAGAAQQQQMVQKAAIMKESAAIQQAQSQTAMNFARAQNYAATAASIPAKLQNESLSAASEASSRELHDQLDSIELAHQR